jgi:FAD/FMN-containing dehydrogenase
MKTARTDSWGRLKRVDRAREDLNIPFTPRTQKTVLPFGNGRSYGDSCHNDDGILIDSRARNAVLSFDTYLGVLRAESGVLLHDILNVLSGSGWFLPVLPGTRFVTLGGAIANDIHGKNHEHRGTFGCHVRSFNLARSDRPDVHCSPQDNSELFAATIGGMGLTGIILDAEIQLVRVPSHYVLETRTAFKSMGGFMELANESNAEYAVAWVDSLAKGSKFGRGIFIEGEHVPFDGEFSYTTPKLNIPFTPPFPLVSGLPLRLFNSAYNFAKSGQKNSELANPNSFFFPLDAIGKWNRLYGPKGLFQHQCVIPDDGAEQILERLLATAQNAGQGSFLTVLKKFGSVKSAGLMSFPKPGFTLTLDFANRGKATRDLLEELDRIVLSVGGRTNPYKDARMSAKTFQAGFPNWEQLEALRDPAMMSDFWCRATEIKHVNAPSLDADWRETQLTKSLNQNLRKQS